MIGFRVTFSDRPHIPSGQINDLNDPIAEGLFAHLSGRGFSAIWKAHSRAEAISYRKARIRLQKAVSLPLLEGEEALQYWTEVLADIEAELRLIARNYPRLLWFFVLRRIPLAVFYGENFSHDWTMQLKRHLEVVGLKYGNDSTKGIRLESHRPEFRLSGKFLSSLTQMIGVSIFYQGLLQMSGAIISGAKIRLDENRIVFDLTEDQKYLNELHQRRLYHRPAKFALTETVGLFSGLETYQSTMFGDQGQPLFGVQGEPFIITTAMIDREIPAMTLNHQLGSYLVSKPSYLPAVLSLESFQEDVTVFEAVLIRLFELKATEVVAFLWALSLYVVEKQHRTIDACIDFAMSGIDVIHLGADVTEMGAWFLLCLRRLGVHLEGEQGHSRLDRLLNYLIHIFGFRAEDADQLRVDDPAHSYLVYCLSKYLVLDFLGIPTLLRDLYEQLDSKESHTPKGKYAERQVAQQLRTAINTNTVFDCPFRFRKGGDAILEVDANLQLDDVLFLVEVKAYSFRPSREDSVRKVWNRWIDIKSWLRDRDSKAQRLAANRIGDNYRIPVDIRYVVPVVCTPFIHHIYSRDETFFLSPTTPRVCTPGEFISFLGRGLPRHIYFRPWCFRVVD